MDVMDITATDAGLALLRVVVGLTLAAHGYAKVFRGGRLAGTARWFDGIGLRPGALHARAAAGTEVLAGALFALGLLTPLAGAAVVALMLVAAWTVHRGKGFFVVGDGWEYNLVLAVTALAVAVTGPGRLSLDAALALPVPAGWSGFAIGLGAGVLGGTAHLVTFFRPPAAAEPAR